jgi:hypothetical protein
MIKREEHMNIAKKEDNKDKEKRVIYHYLTLKNIQTLDLQSNLKLFFFVMKLERNYRTRLLLYQLNVKMVTTSNTHHKIYFLLVSEGTAVITGAQEP